MPRGHHWQMTYDPKGTPPDQIAHLEDLHGKTGYHNCKIIAKTGELVQIKRRVGDPELRFERCDFAVKICDSNVTNYKFISCSFDGTSFENVKFSQCHFENCDFSHVTFFQCHFINNCTFQSNSASAELLRIEETAISATSFMQTLQVNTRFAATAAIADYQRWRYVGTREKIAKTLLNSNRSESDPTFYFEANKQFIICSLDQNVERHRYSAKDEDSKRNLASFYLLSFPDRLERLVLKIAGTMTDWGRTLKPATWFFIAVLALFTMLYWRFDPIEVSAAPPVHAHPFIKSLNITLVAGYTAHFKDTARPPQQWLMFANLVLGLIWYSLVIPVICRKVLR